MVTTQAREMFATQTYGYDTGVWLQYRRMVAIQAYGYDTGVWLRYRKNERYAEMVTTHAREMDGCGAGTQDDYDQLGTNSGPTRNQLGTNSGPNRDQLTHRSGKGHPLIMSCNAS